MSEETLMHHIYSTLVLWHPYGFADTSYYDTTREEPNEANNTTARSKAEYLYHQTATQSYNSLERMRSSPQQNKETCSLSHMTDHILDDWYVPWCFFNRGNSDPISKISAKDHERIKTPTMQLKRHFEMMDLGDASFLLGLSIIPNVKARTMKLTQQTYSREILEKFSTANAMPNTAPAKVETSSIKEELLSPELVHQFRTATGVLRCLCRSI